MMYLVNCIVNAHYYQSNTCSKEMNHIVDANSEDEANSKVSALYEKKDSEYCVWHSVDINYWLTKLVKKGYLNKKAAKTHTQYSLTEIVA